jgi:AraC-like DNA-binding protein
MAQWCNGNRFETMTGRAISLTAGVRTPARTAGIGTTFPAHDLRVFLDGLGRLGYDAGKLLAAAGLRDADLSAPDARVSCEACGAVLARAQHERITPNLALELARVTPLGAWPLVDYLVLTADSVGEGVCQLERYLRLTGSPVSIGIRESVDPIRVEMTAPVPFAIEFDAALIILHFRGETEGRFAAAAISFRHAPDEPAAFQRVLGCPVKINSSWNGVSIPAESWRLPLRRRDPILRRMLEGQANRLLERLSNRTGVALEVQRALVARVTGGDTRIESVARRLTMSTRTLQRRLAEEGVSYQELLDGARKQAAGQYLSESTLAIGEIAYLVGFSEPAAFHRAFKRWFGVTPERFRRQGQTATTP